MSRAPIRPAPQNRTAADLLCAEWTSVPAVVIAGGPSLSGEQLEHVQQAQAAGRCRVIAVNNTCVKAQWADVVYFGDYLALKQYAPMLKPFCRGQWWTGSQAGAQRWQLNLVKTTGQPGLGDDRVHLNGNSGFQAVNLAVLFGARKVVLLGFDMKRGKDGKQHWFGEHPAPLVQVCLFDEWIRKAGPMAEAAAAMGVDIVNCTPGSALTAFRQAELAQEIT